MKVPALGLDALEPLTRYAPNIRSKGLSFVMRYLKNLTSVEVGALRSAGLAIGVIFESTGSRALTGEQGGRMDGRIALNQAQALGVPAGTAIYATVDTDVGQDELPAVENYFAAFDAVLWPDASKPPLYKIGGYADGTALSGLRAHGLPYTWLAGAMGWDGSHDFLANKNPTIVQGPTLPRGGMWHGITWPNLGFAYDPNVLLVEDGGLWLPA